MAVGYRVAMRVHLSLADDVVAAVDAQVGARERSSFIESALRRALADRGRQRALDEAVGSIDDSGHDWDGDPAAWVRLQRTDRQQS